MTLNTDGVKDMSEERDSAYYQRLWLKHEQEVRSNMRKPMGFQDSFCSVIEGKTNGVPLPFSSKFGFRPGEVTMWAGASGHGKSLITGQVAMQLANQGVRACIMSLEMDGSRTLARMFRQTLHRRYAKEDVDRGLDWLDDCGHWLVLYDRLATVTPEEILGAIICAATEHRCQHIYIDNLMKVVRGEDDFNGQKQFLDDLGNLARYFKIHIHLICHLSKGFDPETKPLRGAIKGAGATYDSADNVLVLWRNGHKERIKKMKKEAFNDDDDQEPDSFLIVMKQRNGDWTGDIGLWYDTQSAAFCMNQGRFAPAFSRFSPNWGTNFPATSFFGMEDK